MQSRDALRTADQHRFRSLRAYTLLHVHVRFFVYSGGGGGRGGHPDDGGVRETGLDARDATGQNGAQAADAEAVPVNLHRRCRHMFVTVFHALLASLDQPANAPNVMRHALEVLSSLEQEPAMPAPMAEGYCKAM